MDKKIKKKDVLSQKNGRETDSSMKVSPLNEPRLTCNCDARRSDGE